MFIAPASFAPNTPELYYKSCKNANFDDCSGNFGQFYAGAMNAVLI
jgi:hypothetical protein